MDASTTEVADVPDAISDVENSNVDSSPEHAEQTQEMMDSLQDVSTIKHKTLDSDVLYLNDFSSESERVADELSIEDVSSAPSLVPPDEASSPSHEPERESPVPVPKVIVRKDTARVIRVGGNVAGEKTALSDGNEGDTTDIAPRSPLSGDDNTTATDENISSSRPASPAKEDNDINLSSIVEAPASNTYDVAARLFHALDSDGCGVLEPQAVLNAFNRNRKFLEVD